MQFAIAVKRLLRCSRIVFS